jgi:D-sedoheptulose 7-phosphate isomerase
MSDNADHQFPLKAFSTGGAYFSAYAQKISKAIQGVAPEQLSDAGEILLAAIKRRATIYACGNGGSAAISNHLLCDFVKGVQTGTELRPSVVSLSSHVELLTAIANDISYDEIFLYQLRTLSDAGDVLITISSSGDSENIVRAVDWANANGVHTIALTGFAGGRSAVRAATTIHVPASNYGVVEDVHQMIMHCLAQYLRSSQMDDKAIEQSRF